MCTMAQVVVQVKHQLAGGIVLEERRNLEIDAIKDLCDTAILSHAN